MIEQVSSYEMTGMALGFFNLGPGTHMSGQINWGPKNFGWVQKSW